MPILDPSLTFTLLNSYEKLDSKLNKRFLPYFLKIAADNADHNPQTIEALTLFNIHLELSSLEYADLLNDYQHIKYVKEHRCANNFKYIYDQIDSKYKSDSGVPLLPKGFYSAFSGYNMLLFQPLTFFPKEHAWFLSNTPIAILCIKGDEFTANTKVKLFFELVNIEIDIMAASGLSIVLCIYLNDTIYKKYHEDFLNLITIHPYSEIHISLFEVTESAADIEIFNLRNSKTEPYVYIYGYKTDKTVCINDSKFQHIVLSVDSLISFKQIQLFDIDPFPFCDNGFCTDKIPISLSNVPLFKSEYDNKTTKISGLCYASISKDDFLFNSHKKRVNVYLENSCMNAYVNFEDVHLIRPDFYVEETIYLTKSSKSTLKAIEKLFNEIETDSYKFKNKSNFLSLFKNHSIIECVKYVTSAYVCNIKQKIKNFSIHKIQLLTILETCVFFLKEKSQINNNQKKGFIFQIDTGEGKSCIIQIIAGVLASMDKTVHIISSNINLSNRDYEDSLNFFHTINRTSTLFLHDNERKFSGNYDNLSEDIKSKYPEKYFHENKFANSLKMNIIACDEKDGAKVIFSTLANFQYYYLWLMSKYPGYASKYFNDCYILIDEADSILIDELSNGAILSHSIKTNAEQVLSYVYNNRNKPAETVLNEIKEKFANCKKLTTDDISDMYYDIDIVNNQNFQLGKKYIFEIIDDQDDYLNFYEKYKEDYDLRDYKQKIIDYAKSLLNNENETKKEKKKKSFKKVVPYDSENKGLSEPNKEFSGFIQQFIAIKEKQNNQNENLIISNRSMNYMYVSQPFFINLYKKGICGFTGTIGGGYEKKIYEETYSLIPKKMPRENPNHRVDLPKIVCSMKEKKNVIYEEIMFYHKKNYPVLVVFQDLNELKDFKHFLKSKGLNNFNVFNGKKRKVLTAQTAGVDGAISIGSNACGRGVDIVFHNKPLHIIVAYYTSNSRIIDQILGRTARQGNLGSTRIICSNYELYASEIEFESEEMHECLDDFEIKRMLQVDFINYFIKTRKWIFNDIIGKQIISNKYVEKFRESQINVNRFKACNFEFPVCMNAKTFLKIQIQKIFSLYNLPNCDNTWMIFQRYIREMIFYSLSLTIEEVDKNFRFNKSNKDYRIYLQNKINDLRSLLTKYLPEDNENTNNVISTYMNIYDIVLSKYSKDALNAIPDYLRLMNNQSDNSRFISLSFGFRPYSVGDDSGAKVDTVDGSDETEQRFNCIQDPELKFYQQKPNQNKIYLSITKKVDLIFNKMCQKLNDVINNSIGLNFFLRRTLGGCEFGICFNNFWFLNIEKKVTKYNFLVDKDPLFLFSIHVRSMTNLPILSGVLIFCLVYIASVAKNIFEIIKNPAKGLKIIVAKIIDEFKDEIQNAINNGFKDKIASLFDPIFKLLINQINKQIALLENKKFANVFTKIMDFITNDNFDEIGEKFNELFEGKTIFKIKSLPIKFDLFPIDRFFKLGILLIICISSFMMNFYSHRRRVKYDEAKVAKKFNIDNNVDESIEDNSYIIDEKIPNNSIKEDNINQLLTLTIIVIQATDVPKMDVLTWCDPYVIIKTDSLGEVNRTDCIKNTKNPVWNHKLVLKFKHENINDNIIFKMMDFDEKSKDDFISKLTIPLNSIPINQPIDKWYDTLPGKRTFGQGGKLRISFFLTNS